LPSMAMWSIFDLPRAASSQLSRQPCRATGSSRFLATI
jgi:hypothetical protein